MAAAFLCVLAENTGVSTAGKYISFTVQPCDTPRFLLPVTRNSARKVYERDFSVCLSGPLKFNYSDTNAFVQWMEMNLLLGAQKIIIYNNSGGPELLPYTRYYTRLGLLEIIQWPMPEGVTQRGSDSVWNFAQRAMMNDCLYREMYKAKYVVFTDLDEVILPGSETAYTWSDILHESGCHTKVMAVARNTFYLTNLRDDSRIDKYKVATHLNLTFLLKTRRQDYFWPEKHRSKIIMRPEYIDSTLIHMAFPIGGRRDSTSCRLNPDIAALQHYRSFRKIKHRYRSILDNRAARFSDRLIQRTSRVHREVTEMYSS